MLTEKKTHTEVKNPQIDVRYLADYMASSEQAKNTVLRKCKYRSTARLLQHDEAKLIIAKAFVNDVVTKDHLIQRASWISEKLTTNEFEKKKNAYNADYLRHLAKVLEKIGLPKSAELLPPGHSHSLHINGVRVMFSPSVLLRRHTKTNKVKTGALMLRYEKGKALPASTGGFQSSGILGCLKLLGNDNGSEPEKALCLTLDAHTGKLYEAPGKAVYYFNEMKAVCQGIAERWDAIKPPKSAVL